MNTQQITKKLQLPFIFDEALLLSGLSDLMQEHWTPHFNTGGYSGDWKAIPLYSQDGTVENIFANPQSNGDLKETDALKKSPYFREVINTFKCRVLTARLLRLGAGAEIKPHTDHELGYENDNFRIHIPIITNDRIEFVLDGELLFMNPGECWYTNVNYVHSVKNNSDSDRVHLVIDYERNEWSDQLFFSLAPADSFKPEPKQEESPEQLRMIIAELKRQNQPYVEPLIKELEEKLQRTQ